MLRSGVGLSVAGDAAQAGEQAAGAALAAAGLKRAQAGLCFTTPHFGSGTGALLEAVVRRLGTEQVVGSWTHGLLACGQEPEDPAAAVLIISGIEARGFLLGELAGDEGTAGEEILERLGGQLRREDLVVLAPDAQGLLAAPLLGSLREALAPARLVGAGAAAGTGGFSLQWCGEAPQRGALAGMLIRGMRVPRLQVASACRSASEPMCVTRARGHWILELDGRPALDVYRRVARAPLAADLKRAAAHLLVALRVGAAPDRDGCVIRNPVGFDAREGAFAVPDAVKPGERIALVLRDAGAARAELKAMLARAFSRTPAQQGREAAAQRARKPEGRAARRSRAEAGPRKAGERRRAPAFGLYFGCRSGGGSFLGAPGLEAAYLQNACGSVPVLGIRGAFEYGPAGDRVELLTHAAVLALVDG